MGDGLLNYSNLESTNKFVPLRPIIPDRHPVAL